MAAEPTNLPNAQPKLSAYEWLCSAASWYSIHPAATVAFYSFVGVTLCRDPSERVKMTAMICCTAMTLALAVMRHHYKLKMAAQSEKGSFELGIESDKIDANAPTQKKLVA